MRELIGSNQMLEHQLRLCRAGRGQEVGGATIEELKRERKALQEQVRHNFVLCRKVTITNKESERFLAFFFERNISFHLMI